MKKLFLIRHAKSSWADEGISDFDRPLNQRGLHDAPIMAERFLALHGKVDKIISSPALRAITTANIFANRLSISNENIIEDKQIYEAHPNTLIKIINAFDNNWQTAIMFGHNPGFSYAAELLTSELINKVTCSISEIDLHIADWTLCASGVGSLISYDFPKNI